MAAIDRELRDKNALLERSGIARSDWPAAIKLLGASGQVVQEGEKRGQVAPSGCR